MELVMISVTKHWLSDVTPLPAAVTPSLVYLTQGWCVFIVQYVFGLFKRKLVRESLKCGSAPDNKACWWLSVGSSPSCFQDMVKHVACAACVSMILATVRLYPDS